MKSFKMEFNQYMNGQRPFVTNKLQTQTTQSTANAPQTRVQSSALNAPMIDRVHKARPGCSACGKKIA